MTNNNVSGYINRLSRVLLETRATERNGDPLPFDEAADKAAGLIRETAENGGVVMLVANGGSAAVASHMQNDLSKACGVRAMVFTETPLLTALTNDNGYESAYETTTRLWAKPGDLLIAISSSGRSENILRAVEAASAAGAVVITMSGFDEGNPLLTRGRLNFYVDSNHYGLVETSHAAISHFLTDSVAGLLELDGVTG